MRILVIGGTQFLGRFIVESALLNGFQVTLFNRGQSHPNLFQGVETVVGDRNEDITKLEGEWDVVIDACGYFPKSVSKSVEHLKNRVCHYIFVSSVSVYPDLSLPSIDESTPTAKPDSPDDLINDEGRTYGIRKRACEEAVTKEFGIHSTIVRPGLIVGPYDQTWRFPYWIERIKRGGKVLAPGNPENRIQFIDVKDLANWIVHLAQEKISGIFNAVGPESPPTFSEFLSETKLILKSECEFIWVSEEFLFKEDVPPWTGLPLWLPESSWGIHRVSNDLAKKNNLSFSLIKNTIKDTDHWITENSLAAFVGYGIKHEREMDLIKKWKLDY